MGYARDLWLVFRVVPFIIVIIHALRLSLLSLIIYPAPIRRIASDCSSFLQLMPFNDSPAHRTHETAAGNLDRCKFTHAYVYSIS